MGGQCPPYTSLKRHSFHRHRFVCTGLLLCIAGSVQGQEKLDLRLHFRKGDVREISLNLTQTIDGTVQGIKQRAQQTVALGYSLTVQDLDDQGTATVAIKYTSASFHLKSQSGEMSYDSTQPASAPPAPTGAFAALVGQGYSATISAAGNVEAVTGLDALSKAVLSRLNIPEGPARAAWEKKLAQQFSAPAVKSQLQRIFAVFPDHPVAIGENWYRKNQLSPEFPLTLEATYTLKSRDNGLATIEVAGRSATVPNAVVDAGQMKMTYDLHGDFQGQFQIDESSGWPISSSMTQSLAGGAAIHTPGNPPQVVPITVESSMKVSS